MGGFGKNIERNGAGIGHTGKPACRGDLVGETAVDFLQTHEPVQFPTGLVQNVRDPITTLGNAPVVTKAVILHSAGESIAELEASEQIPQRRGTSGDILVVVSGVVPSASGGLGCADPPFRRDRRG